MGELLDQWQAHFPMILKRMLELEAQDSIPGLCQRCRLQAAQYRCRECAHPVAACEECIKFTHIQTPLHWVEKWNEPGEYFDRVDLATLGHVWYLGHGGEPCPELSSLRDPTPRLFTVTHTNGIHVCKIMMCRCASYLPLLDQLLLAQLFPASVEQPQSVFTFAVMSDAHLDTLTSKKSSYDYIRKLRRLTNNAGAHKVKVRAWSW